MSRINANIVKAMYPNVAFPCLQHRDKIQTKQTKPTKELIIHDADDDDDGDDDNDDSNYLANYFHIYLPRESSVSTPKSKQHVIGRESIVRADLRDHSKQHE